MFGSDHGIILHGVCLAWVAFALMAFALKEEVICCNGTDDAQRRTGDILPEQ